MDTDEVRQSLVSYLQSDESLLEGEQRPAADMLARELVSLGPGPAEKSIVKAVAKTLERPIALPDGCTEAAADDRSEACVEALEKRADQQELIADIAGSLPTPIAERWRRAQAAAGVEPLLTAAGVTTPNGDRGVRLRQGVAAALLDVRATSGLLPASASEGQGTLQLRVNGVPVLHRGLSKSVTANQFKSLALALGLVLLIMVALFRSVFGGLLAAAPMVLTLLVIYGIMGMTGLHLDIGTSMLASIIIGAGVDYAVHLLAAWRADDGEELSSAARRAAERAGPAIWTNALMVCAGFFVLTLGEAKPLQNVGGLTATAMITAALATFLALPVLARKRRYGRL